MPRLVASVGSVLCLARASLIRSPPRPHHQLAPSINKSYNRHTCLRLPVLTQSLFKYGLGLSLCFLHPPIAIAF